LAFWLKNYVYHSTLSFVNLDQYSGLVIGIGGESLGLLGRNSGVSLDESSHDTTSSFNTQRQRSNIEKQKILDSLRFISL
jgi:hypothetical protein